MAFDTEEGSGRRLRKRKVQQQHSDDSEAALEQLLEVAANAQKIVVFSGSGLSASSGMSTFSTRGGLYERAQKKFKLTDGKMLFTYAFFDRQRPEAQAFFADIYSEAVLAEPAAGHHALRHLFDAGRLHRHYTMNIDGLAGQVGMDTWHHEHNTGGVTVEMHGNVHFLVCPECHATAPMDAALAKKIRAKQIVPCTAPDCGEGSMRFKVMMYDDGEAECITPDDVMELMEADVKAADLVLWVGISFQQSASTLYFRKVRCWIQEAGRLDIAVQALVNPSDEALFNLRTAMSNQSELRVLEVLAESDEALPLLADRLRTRGNGGGGGGGAMGVGASPVLAAANRAWAAAAAAAAYRAKKEQQEQAAGAAGAALAATHVLQALVGAPPVLASPGAAVKQESFGMPQQQPQQQHSHQVLGLPPLRAQVRAPVPQMSTPEALLKAVGFPGIPLQPAAPGSFPSQQQAGQQAGQQLPAILQLSQQQQQATIHTLELLQAALQAALHAQLGGAGQAQSAQQRQQCAQQQQQQQQQCQQQQQKHQQQQQQQQCQQQQQPHQQQGQQSQQYNKQQEHQQLQPQQHQQQHQSAFPAHQGASLAQLLGGLQSAAVAAAATGGQRNSVSPSPQLQHAQQQQQQQAWALQAASVVAAAGGAAFVKREQSPQGVVLQEQLSHESEQYEQQQAGQR